MSKKAAFIKGATAGLGHALVKELMGDGYQIVLSSRDAARLKAIYRNQPLLTQADSAAAAGAKHIFAEITHNVMPAVFTHCVGVIRLGALHDRN
jgi:short-subunit dehydrogenase